MHSIHWKWNAIIGQGFNGTYELNGGVRVGGWWLVKNRIYRKLKIVAKKIAYLPSQTVRDAMYTCLWACLFLENDPFQTVQCLWGEKISELKYFWTKKILHV